MSFSLQATKVSFKHSKLLLIPKFTTFTTSSSVLIVYKLDSYKIITVIIFFQKVLHFVEQFPDTPRGKAFHCHNVSDSFSKSI